MTPEYVFVVGNAAEWLNWQHSHDVTEPYILLPTLALAVKGACSWEHGQVATVIGKLTVPIRGPKHAQYVTVNDIGRVMCEEWLGSDPGARRLIGEAWRLRVLALRQSLTKEGA